VKGTTLTIREILEPIADELAQVEETLQDTAQVEYAPLAEVVRYIVGSGGKRIRPALVLLAAKFYPADFEKVVYLAAAVETLHTATLVHDDMIDRSLLRRGHPTLNALWSDGATVLAGDYIFARAAGFAAATGNVRVVQLFAEVLKTIVDGELRQLFQHYDGLPPREDYYRRIFSKTASLFALATEASGELVGAPEEQVAALRDYGYHLGMAFQIVDDVLDFVGDEAELGKPIGSDLRQGTVTLPVYYFAEAFPDHPALRAYWNADPDRETAVNRLVRAIRDSKAIEEALNEARRFAADAQAALVLLPDIPARRSLHELTNYVVERRR
jgi:geranylgeranyl pyrophosphate synthase